MNVVFFVLEILGTIAFALSGTLTAIKKEMDILGGCVLGMSTAVGGGIIRDLILGVTPPTALLNPLNAFICIFVSILVYLPFMQKLMSINNHKIYDKCLLVVDSVGLGVFTVIGINTCFLVIETPNLFTAVFSGVITGVGGGILRDVFSRDVPKIFVKHFYASASIVGAIACYFIKTYVNSLLATIISTLTIITLRLIASKFKWELPKPKHLNK